LFDQVTYHDIETKIRVKAQEKLADVYQQHETLVIVVSSALGGKGSSKSSTPSPKSFAEAEVFWANVMG